MKICIIVTTYNRPDALEKVLEGLGCQTRSPDEVIVADDGSGDETALCIQKQKEKYTFPLMHVWHEDRGFRVARIRNLAIHRTTADYLVFLDGDCMPDRHFVSDHLRSAKKGAFFQGKRVLTSMDFADTITCRTVNSPWSRAGLLFGKKVSNRHHLLRFPVFPYFSSKKQTGIRGCNMGVFRRDMISVNGFNQDYEGWGREDSDLAVRLFRFGLVKRTHPFLAVVYHLWHPEEARGRLSHNDQLLENTIKDTNYVCQNGLVTKS